MEQDLQDFRSRVLDCNLRRFFSKVRMLAGQTNRAGIAWPTKGYV